MSVLNSQNQKANDEEEIYFNFINSIKSETTKRVYDRDLKFYLNFCNLNKMSGLLEIKDPQRQIINYIMHLRKRGLAANSVSTMLMGIYHFYEMNDIPLNKKKINMFKGEFSRKVIDRAYTDKEIKKLLDVSDLRMKSVILLMASSGMRIGAIPGLKIRNLEKIDSIYKITVYEGTNEQYYTFCTPECAYYIDAYFLFRTNNGEKIQKDSYLIRDQFDITDIEQVRNRSKGVALNTLRTMMNNNLIKAGLKTVDSTGYNRKEVALAHGLRKFFTTELTNLKINPEIREMLLGHKIGLASCYYRPTQEEMLKEYEKGIDSLTINEENRLRRELEQKIQIEKSQFEALKEDFDKLKKEVMKRRK